MKCRKQSRSIEGCRMFQAYLVTPVTPGRCAPSRPVCSGLRALVIRRGSTRPPDILRRLQAGASIALPRFSVILLCLLLPAALDSRGQETSASRQVPQSRQLTLAQAQKMALERNWDLLASAVGVDAATAQKIVAREFPNPALSLSTV